MCVGVLRLFNYRLWGSKLDFLDLERRIDQLQADLRLVVIARSIGVAIAFKPLNEFENFLMMPASSPCFFEFIVA